MALDARTIRDVVGPLEDERVARIARTGITLEQLREAALRVQASEQRAALERGGAPVVHEVVLLLQRLASDEDMDADCMD